MIALTIYRAEYYNSLNSGNCKISFGLIINPNKKHISILSFTSLYYNLCFQCLCSGFYQCTNYTGLCFSAFSQAHLSSSYIS